MSQAASGGRAYRRVLDQVGRAVISGDLPPGRIITLDWAIAQTGASRSVVREATRVLVSLGLLVARQRVGLIVTASTAWDVLDGDVVRWRLDSADRESQLIELLELRLAVEPAAARAAATRRTDQEATALATAAADLKRAATRRDAVAFFNADQVFHGILIAASGNRIYSRLRAVLEEGLREQTPDGPPRWDAAPGDVELHARLAAAIERRDARSASTLSARIIHDG